MFLTILSLTLVKGSSFLIDRRYQLFTLCCILYLLISPEAIITRILFGAGWFWAIIIVVCFNGSLSSMTKKFIIEINDTIKKKYVIFSISQGISKWRSAKNELFIKFIYNALELLPFFLLSATLIELVSDKLRGLGVLLLEKLKTDLLENHFDCIDEITVIVLLLVAIVRSAKVLSIFLENKLNIAFNEK